MSVESRNAAAVVQALSAAEARTFAQEVRLDGLVATVGGLLERMAALERMVMVGKAASVGHGPTVR